MESNPTPMLVVAAALRRDDGCWLMHRRPAHKPHGGLWEFPGGKVEPGEMPAAALVREIEEELGVRLDAGSAMPARFAETGAEWSGQPIVILLYTVTRWDGDPVSREGGEAGWFDPAQIARLDRPPLDIELTERLFGLD